MSGSAWNKGIPRTSAEKDKISRTTKAAMQKIQLVAWNKGKKLSPEHIAKVVAQLKLRKLSPETKRKIAIAHLGLHHTQSTKEKLSALVKKRYMEHPELCEISRQRALSMILPKKDTSIEIALQQELTARKIAFEKHRVIENCVPDLIIGNKLIFADGCYWHGCEKHCRKFGLLQARVIAKDRRQEQQLAQKGYTLFRFWEHEILNNAASCIDKVRS